MASPKVTDKGLSVYKGELTLRTVLEQNIEIAKAFPQLPSGFYEVLNRRLAEKEFTDERLKDAVNHVIDTCSYPVPTVANFLSYDRNVEVLTHGQVTKRQDEGLVSWNDYEAIRIPEIDKPRFVRKEDVIKYKLQRWNNANM